MKKLIATALFSVAAAACGDDSGLTDDISDDTDETADEITDNDDDQIEVDAPPGVTVVEVAEGDITTDTVWTANNEYHLKGYVFVTGGTLTIEPGTVIKGDNGSALAITKDAKLNAVRQTTWVVHAVSVQPAFSKMRKTPFQLGVEQPELVRASYAKPSPARM